MDHRSFDRLARALGRASNRRSGLTALAGALGLLGGAGLAGADTDAQARRRRADRIPHHADAAARPDAVPAADRRRKKKRRCSPACDGGFTCVKGRCACASGVSCGAACCAAGQACRDGACADRPAPGSCIAAGEPCKNVGRACCDGRVCASGQGGLADVACYSPKTGPCTASADCVYGMTCRQGRCEPPRPGDLGEACDATSQQLCATPGATCTPYTAPEAPSGSHCTLPLRATCIGAPDCTCYRCWYVNGGAEAGGRAGRSSLNTKACCLPAGQTCATEADCCSGLTCTGGVCGGAQCIPDGGEGCADDADCCGGLACGSGGICGASPACTIERTSFADDTSAGQALKELVEDPSGPNPILLGPGVYAAPLTSDTTFLTVARGTVGTPLVIAACQPASAQRAVLDGGSTVVNGGPATGGASWTWAGGKRIMKVNQGAAVKVEGVDFRNGNAGTATGGAVSSYHATVELASLTISGCSGSMGGGVDFWATDSFPGTLTLTGVTVSRCKAAGPNDTEGGGVSYMGTGLTVTGSASAPSRFEHNYAVGMGGGAQVWGNSGPQAIEWLEVEDNAAGAEAGGIVLNGSQAAIIRNARIVGNTAGKRGGGLYIQNSGNQPVHQIESTVIANNLSGTGNVGSKDGGGIALFYAGLELKGGTVIRGNATSGAGTGAGIYNQGAVTCTGSPTICCNPASGTQDSCASTALGAGCSGVCASVCDATCPAA